MGRTHCQESHAPWAQVPWHAHRTLSCPGAQTLWPLLCQHHQGPHVRPTTSTTLPHNSSLPDSGLSQHGTRASLSDTRAPKVREGPQPRLYLEEARRHGAHCHCIAGGYAPHHRAGGGRSALQGGRYTRVRSGRCCPSVPASQQAASPTEQGTLAI